MKVRLDSPHVTLDLYYYYYYYFVLFFYFYFFAVPDLYLNCVLSVGPQSTLILPVILQTKEK